MRKSSNDEIRGIAVGGAIGMGILLLLFLLAVMIEPKYAVPAALILTAGLTGICLLAYLVISYRIRGTAEKLSRMLESLICAREEVVFPTAEDTMLSKIQVQALKLYDILRSYEEKEISYRKQLSKNIGDLVHQINTPITNIELYVQFLEREDLTKEERKNIVESIKIQSRKLVWLGEGFSKISRLESGMISLKPARQPVRPVLLQAISQVMPKAILKDMDIVTDIGGDVEAEFDRRWTEEAFFNVLDNAVKYGNDRSNIHIKVMEYASYICVCVKNEGIPIPKEDYHKIFTRFYRGKATESLEGVGLGLYLVREIFSGQGGYIKVESGMSGITQMYLYLYTGQAR